jgi:AraC family transcriptional regulator of adaptative response/methylated-DNA-[protein]-cysteine methyltransferase
MTLTNTTMYNALVKKDPSYEGIFYAAVKTTGIFCRPTCTARKPNKENVEFFKSSKEALERGYRPCKICSPLDKPGETPAYIKHILKDIDQNPAAKIKDSDLHAQKIEPHTIRRWFLKNHGMTFHAYQRMLRINAAFKQIQKGDKVTTTAFDTGYESLSGFTDSYKSVIGTAPSKSNHKQVIDFSRIATPLGTMVACANDDGICLLEFADRRMLETELNYLRKKFNASIIQGKNKHLDALELQLTKYFEGKLKEFTLSLVSSGTDFQNSVWSELQKIPHGTTRSYKQVAASIKQPTAVRAVANANGMNRIAIIIPCHRVIGSDGHLTGYGGGLWRKKWLLELEQSANELKLKLNSGELSRSNL